MVTPPFSPAGFHHLATLGLAAYGLIFGLTILESTAFVGLFIPGTTALVFAGFLSAQGILDFEPLLAIVALGGIIGDMISFNLGRIGIEKFAFGRRLLKPKYLKRGEAFFREHGEKSIALARFIGPLRPVIPFVAGLCKMPRPRFFLYNVVSGIISATLYLSLGYFFGDVWGSVRHIFHRFEVPLIIVSGGIFVSYFWRKELFK